MIDWEFWIMDCRAKALPYKKNILYGSDATSEHKARMNPCPTNKSTLLPLEKRQE